MVVIDFPLRSCEVIDGAQWNLIQGTTFPNSDVTHNSSFEIIEITLTIIPNSMFPYLKFERGSKR